MGHFISKYLLYTVKIFLKINHSDENLFPISHTSGTQFQDTGEGQTPQALGSNHNLSEQSYIKTQSLTLGACLDTMESCCGLAFRCQP